MDVIDHIKQLDKEHGGKLYDLYERNKTYDSVLAFYFGDVNQLERLQFDISLSYCKQLKNILYHGEIDFDKYFIYLQTFFKDLITSDLKPNDDGIINLDGRLRIKKAFKKNEFIFSPAASPLKIKITFEIKLKQLNPKTFIDSQNNTIIELTNITTENLRHNTYWNKSCSRITPYTLVFILILLIIFSYCTDDIINLTQHLFDNTVYSKIAALIFVYCLVIAVSPIYQIIEALRKYSKISLSFKINKKYSNTENYLNEFDSEKKQNFTIFENLERAVSVPNEDFLGYNLLSASLFYNGIKDSFDPNINLIKIIDAKRGMGKTSFINLLVQRIHGFTYRHDGGCQLFKQILFNKQIKVVQFSIMPFLATLNNSIDDEKKCIDNFITYIADNLTPSSSRYLKAILSSTTAINDKFNLERFISQIINNDDMTKLKNNLKISEQKNLIIIEDLDRLNEDQLKIFVKALWFIHDLPFTITLLPCEDNKIRSAINHLSIISNSEDDTQQKFKYAELEEYKLLQPAFNLKEYFYKILSIYTIRLFNRSINQWQINNDYIQIKQLINKEISQDDITNDWVYHLYNNHLFSFNDYDIMQLNSKDITNSIKNDLAHIFEKYNISIREFKSIIGQLHIGTNRLFIVQQIIFYMIEYRYKYESGIIEYLNKYDAGNNFKKNRYLNSLKQKKFLNDRLDGFSSGIKEIILELEMFPPNINYGVKSFINSLFGFTSHRGNQFDKSVNVFYSEFIVVFLTNNGHGQYIYDILSLNWHEQYDQLSRIRGNADQLLNCKDEFILSFNIHAEETVLGTINRQKLPYNLFLYQNFAILLLLMIRNRLNSNLEPEIYNYFQGDKLYNHSIRIYNQFYDTKISLEIDIMINYFRRLFNINHNNFEYDKTYHTLKNNYNKLRSELILDNTDPKFREVFTKIFKVNFTVEN